MPRSKPHAPVKPAKGFAVVANEVKELAKQTAKATEDISRKITAIQTDTQGAVDAIGSITAVINQVNDISSTIATAVEEQSATTNEMTRNVADAAKGSGEITQNIGGVAEAARGTSSSAQESQKAANDLAGDGGTTAQSCRVSSRSARRRRTLLPRLGQCSAVQPVAGCEFEILAVSSRLRERLSASDEEK